MQITLLKGFLEFLGMSWKKLNHRIRPPSTPKEQLMWKENPSVIGFIQYPMNPKRYPTNQHIKQEDGHENISGSKEAGAKCKEIYL